MSYDCINKMSDAIKSAYNTNEYCKLVLRDDVFDADDYSVCVKDDIENVSNMSIYNYGNSIMHCICYLDVYRSLLTVYKFSWNNDLTAVQYHDSKISIFDMPHETLVDVITSLCKKAFEAYQCMLHDYECRKGDTAIDVLSTL